MILSSNAKKVPILSDTQQITRETGDVLSQKLWLPKLIYAALPYFYLASGTAALVATLYISHWSWVLPHYILFSVACLHMGVLIYRKRNRNRVDDKRE